jgi:hypothetical protein
MKPAACHTDTKQQTFQFRPSFDGSARVRVALPSAPLRVAVRRVAVLTVAALLVILGVSARAEACPRCSEGEAARQLMYADGFLRNLASLLLPFVLVGAVSAGAQGIGRRGATKPRGEGS